MRSDNKTSQDITKNHRLFNPLEYEGYDSCNAEYYRKIMYQGRKVHSGALSLENKTVQKTLTHSGAQG